MLDLEKIRSLYASVVSRDLVDHRADDSDVEACLGHLLGNAAPEPEKKALDYGRAACRLAYLHAYAPLHTEIAKRATLTALKRHRIGNARGSRVLKLCSLGGGPGCDVVGLLSALDSIASQARFETVLTAVVESAAHPWGETFASLIREIRRNHGEIALRFSDDSLHWKYVESDLVRITDNRVRDALSSSSLVVMSQFLSVLNSGDAESVMDNVFSRIGPGSFVLILFDADDALTRRILRQARHYQLNVVHWARNRSYSFEELKTTLYGHSSCHRAVVNTYLFRKSLYASRDGPDSQRSKCPERLCEKCFDGVTPVPDLILKKCVRTLRCVACEDDYCGSKISSGSGSFGSDESKNSIEEDNAFLNVHYPWKECKLPLDGIVPLTRAGRIDEDQSGELEKRPQCRCRLL